MTTYKLGDVVDLLEGGSIVGKGTILHMGPNAILHGLPLPAGHLGMSIHTVYKGDVEIPYPPPHDEDITTLGAALGAIIAWPRVACAVCMSKCATLRAFPMLSKCIVFVCLLCLFIAGTRSYRRSSFYLITPLLSSIT